MVPMIAMDDSETYANSSSIPFHVVANFACSAPNLDFLAKLATARTTDAGGRGGTERIFVHVFKSLEIAHISRTVKFDDSRPS